MTDYEKLTVFKLLNAISEHRSACAASARAIGLDADISDEDYAKYSTRLTNSNVNLDIAIRAAQHILDEVQT